MSRPPLTPGLVVDELLAPGEAATLLHVAPGYVTRLAKVENLTVSRTLGGHCRLRRSEVFDLVAKRAARKPKSTKETR